MTRVLGLFVAAAVGLMPTLAAAHGGPLVYAGEAGPYRVEAYRLFGVSGEQDVLTYTIFLREAQSGRPVDGATVFVSVRREEEMFGPSLATGFTNQYEVQFDVPTDDGTWLVDVEIQGQLGATELTHGLAPPSSWTETVLPWAIGIIVIAVGWALSRIRSRRLTRSAPGHVPTGRTRSRSRRQRSPNSRRRPRRRR